MYGMQEGIVLDWKCGGWVARQVAFSGLRYVI